MRTDPNSRPVVLIGYRGTGKSRVGPLLAQILGSDFVDADLALEQVTGQTIAQIFAERGESAFRDLESSILQELLLRPNIVLATGGGVVLRDTNRQMLRTSARWIAWLTAPVDVIAARLRADPLTATSRPSLTTLTPQAEIAALLMVREPLYRELASATYATEQATPEQIALEISTHLSGSQSAP